MRTILVNSIMKKAQINICSSNNTLKVSENSADAKLKELTFEGLNDFVFAFKMDYYCCFSQYFKSAEKFNKACDCVIIYKNNNIINALFVELKSDAPRDFVPKFKASMNFLNYLKDLIMTFHEIDISINNIYLLCTTRTKKQTIKHSPPSKIVQDGFSYYEKSCKNKSHVYVNEYS